MVRYIDKLFLAKSVRSVYRFRPVSTFSFPGQTHPLLYHHEDFRAPPLLAGYPQHLRYPHLGLTSRYPTSSTPNRCFQLHNHTPHARGPLHLQPRLRPPRETRAAREGHLGRLRSRGRRQAQLPRDEEGLLHVLRTQLSTSRYWESEVQRSLRAVDLCADVW